MEIGYAKSFRKEYTKLPKKVKEQFASRMEIFLENPFDPILNNHILHVEYEQYRSINVNGDFRAIYKEKNGIVEFGRINTHSHLYG